MKIHYTTPSTDRNGNPELFVKVSYKDEDGVYHDHARWLTPTEYADYAANNKTLEEIMLDEKATVISRVKPVATLGEVRQAMIDAGLGSQMDALMSQLPIASFAGSRVKSQWEANAVANPIAGAETPAGGLGGSNLSVPEVPTP